MKKQIKYIISATLIFLNQNALAESEATINLSKCFAEKISADEKLIVTEWLYAGISNYQTNPPTNQTTNQQENINKNMGSLFSRLIAEKCPKEALAAVKNDGPSSFRTAFSDITQEAIKNLLEDPNVKESLSKFSEYIDKEKIKSAL